MTGDSITDLLLANSIILRKVQDQTLHMLHTNWQGLVLIQENHMVMLSFG
jgi:hypothetical protein